MINKNDFHIIYQNLPFSNLDVEDYLFDIFQKVKENLNKRTNNDLKVEYEDNIILEYILQEFVFSSLDGNNFSRSLIYEKSYIDQFISVVTDKFFFNELNPYHAISLVSKYSPVISNLELHLNFILNRLNLMKKDKNSKDTLLDMISKVFLMFKSIIYLITSGAETEAFATWRTIHELECVIKIIFEHQEVIPTYLQHIVYNNAFRDDFEDKDLQQSLIDDLKNKMKEKNYKSKDMKKYIEYGWLYAIKDVDKIENFKLNFRNGLEVVAGLDSYSYDYEMSSEVAHSSPLLIYSNKQFYKSITIVRMYESFFRLEKIFFELLKNSNVDYASYEKMRNLYLEFSKKILNREISLLQSLITKRKDNN